MQNIAWKLFFADLSDAPETLKGAKKVNENSRNYRLAYTMMLGLETVVRINAHSRLRIFQQSVLGLSSFVDACKDYLEEIDFGFLNEVRLRSPQSQQYCCCCCGGGTATTAA